MVATFATTNDSDDGDDTGVPKMMTVMMRRMAMTATSAWTMLIEPHKCKMLKTHLA